MSRSRKKTPIFGYANADSEAQDKRIWHSRVRHRERQALHTVEDFDTHLTTTDDQVSSTWEMDKDGKHFWPEKSREETAAWVAERSGKTDRERATLKRRLMRKWMAK
jgi:hypothetical protein